MRCIQTKMLPVRARADGDLSAVLSKPKTILTKATMQTMTMTMTMALTGCPAAAVSSQSCVRRLVAPIRRFLDEAVVLRPARSVAGKQECFMATVAVIRSRLWMELGDREPLSMVYCVLWVKTSFVSRLWRRLAHVIPLLHCFGSASETGKRPEGQPRHMPICVSVGSAAPGLAGRPRAAAALRTGWLDLNAASPSP